MSNIIRYRCTKCGEHSRGGAEDTTPVCDGPLVIVEIGVKE